MQASCSRRVGSGIRKRLFVRDRRRIQIDDESRLDRIIAADNRTSRARACSMIGLPAHHRPVGIERQISAAGSTARAAIITESNPRLRPIPTGTSRQKTGSGLPYSAASWIAFVSNLGIRHLRPGRPRARWHPAKDFSRVGDVFGNLPARRTKLRAVFLAQQARAAESEADFGWRDRPTEVSNPQAGSQL